MKFMVTAALRPATTTGRSRTPGSVLAAGETRRRQLRSRLPIRRRRFQHRRERLPRAADGAAHGLGPCRRSSTSKCSRWSTWARRSTASSRSWKPRAPSWPVRTNSAPPPTPARGSTCCSRGPRRRTVRRSHHVNDRELTARRRSGERPSGAQLGPGQAPELSGSGVGLKIGPRSITGCSSSWSKSSSSSWPAGRDRPAAGARPG